MSRVTVIVLDSFGVGELPDAARFGDTGADTMGHIREYMDEHEGGLKVPNMEKLGLFNIDGVRPGSVTEPAGAYGKCMEKADAKDTINGHFEISGLVVEKPFRTFPNGFPKEILDDLTRLTGVEFIGNEVASGTEIIERLGDEHVRTGKVIVYTSADSVMQFAVHEDVIPLERQYEICEIARKRMVGDDAVGRIIARPFTGTSGSYKRTEHRRDFALDPPAETLLDFLKAKGKDVIGVGKIEDIFNHRGLTEFDHTTNNVGGIDATINYLKKPFDGFMFVNLVDYDMLYGHRRDPLGYGRALEYFDQKLPEIMDAMEDDDILMLTADHGCDPTFKGSDHTREYIPLVVYGKNLKKGVNLGVRASFADIAATTAEALGFEFTNGTSFLKEIK